MRIFNKPYVFLILLLTSATLAAQNQEIKPVVIEKIKGDVYEILGGRGARGGLYIGDNSVLLIDSKMNKESVEQTLSALKIVTDKPIEYLVNTHSDGDHIMGNRYFPKSVTFVAHENCRDDFFKTNFGRESDWGLPEYFPFVPSVTFNNEMTIWLGTKKVKLYYFGVGHTTGDIVVYFPDEKIAFVGDQYFSDRPQLIHSIKNGNSFEHVKTLDRMLDTIDAELFCCGHCDIADRKAIKKHIKEMTDRQKKVENMIKKEKTKEEILSEFEDNEARLITSIYNEIIASQKE